MKNTNIKLRNLVIYQIYVRNFTEEGTFSSVIPELDRIKSLGVDVVYLLPIHPIGEVDRKGKMGCPYSIKDYREVNPELGTKADFENLVNEIHNRKMKVMIDVVYNHTSKDSVLLETHPEYFLRDETGILKAKEPDWSDVTDLDFNSSKALWDELADTLMMYSKMGVDAYRCDVASFVPIDFWTYIRKQVRRVNRNTFWLSESVHGSYVKVVRDRGYDVLSESEIYQAFDIAYDYDVEPYYREYLLGLKPLKDYLEGIKRQEEIYPANYVKMKNLENHDIDRIAKYVKNDSNKIKNWTAFNFFQKGCVMLYMGEEYSSDIKPTLFDKELYNKNEDISDLIKKLTRLKKKSIFAKGIFTINVPEIDGVAHNVIENDKDLYIGVFNVGLSEGEISINIPDGHYRNYLTGKIVKVLDGKIKLIKEPIILRLKK